MARYGMTIPLESLPLAAQKDWIQELESLGYEDLWSSEAQDCDGFYFIGPPDRIREDLQRFFDNGADTVIVASLETACDPREAARVVAPGAR